MKNFKLAEGIVLGIIIGAFIYITSNSNKPAYADNSFDMGYFLGMMTSGIVIGLVIELVLTFFRAIKK